jgi:hypothetical protein
VEDSGLNNSTAEPLIDLYKSPLAVGLRELRSDSIIEAMKHNTQLWEAPGTFGCHDSSHGNCVANLVIPANVDLLRRGLLFMSDAEYKSIPAILTAAQISKLKKIPFANVVHDLLTALSADSDSVSLQRLAHRLPPEILDHGIPTVVKTVTLLVHMPEGYKRLVITEIGDVELDVECLHTISAATGISYNRLRSHSHINAKEFQPIETLGQAPGNVGAFPHHVHAIDHFIYRRLHAPEFVSIRVMPFYTMCIHRTVFEAVAFAHLNMLGHNYICV